MENQLSLASWIKMMDLIIVEYFYDTICFDACEDTAGNFNLTDIAKEFIGRTKGIFLNM